MSRPSSRLNVGDPIPLVLTKEQLAEVLGYSLTQIDRFRRLRNHPAIKQLPGPGHPRFDGRALKAWMDSSDRAPIARHFFGHARERR